MPSLGANTVNTTALLLIALLTSSCSDSTAPPKATRLVFLTAPPAAETMVPLSIQPVVQTVDANGRAAGGATTITATVIAGSGEIEAGGTATTDATGRASFSGLTIGTVNGAGGPVTLQFAAPVLDPITATIDLRCALLPLSVGQTIGRSLTTGDCLSPDGRYVNVFNLPTTQPITAVQLTLDGAFPGSLELQGPNDMSHYYWGYGWSADATDHRISYKVLLPPGATYIAVDPAQVGVVGAYTLTTAPAPEDLTCDDLTPLGATPLTSVQKLGPGDCARNSFFEDFLVVGLPPLATVTVSMMSSAFNPAIEVLDASTGGVETSSTGQGTTSVSFTNTTAAAASYELAFTSAVPGASGAYNFTLNITYPSGSAARAPSGASMLLARPLIPFRSPQGAH